MEQRRTGRLEGKVAIVTGGSRGLGVAIVQTFAAAGARVAILARDPSKGEAVAAEVRNSGGEAVFVATDVSREKDAEKAVSVVTSQLGRPQILVNNAALTPSRYGKPSGTAVEINLNTWRRFLDVNLTGALLMARHVVPAMLEAGDGSIVNINSLVAQHPTRSNVAYAASKAGLSGLTRAMAVDFGPHVRVNEIVTGVILNADNPRHRRLLADTRHCTALAENTLVGRRGVPQDVALACLYLASNESGFLTGQSIVLDGGSHVPIRTVSGAVQG
jgi:NAD(P)-dependent dehydrogenase (short-subunit alcohol dehydrogenase family)